MTKIKIYDAIMGNGKTERIIKDLAHESRPIIYITPLLTEVVRVSGAIINAKGQHMKDDFGNFMYDTEHPLANKRFYLPNNQNSSGSKLDSIRSLVAGGHNICSTHKLFSMLDLDTIKALRDNQYVLVADESLEVWSKFDLGGGFSEDSSAEDLQGLSKTDKNIQTMIKNGFIVADPMGLLWWQEDKFHDAENTLYANVKKLCDLKQLYISNGRVVFWELNHTVLSAFDEVLMATYMFDYSFMKYYLDIHEYSYEVERFGLVPKDYAKFVSVFEGKMNVVGEKDFSLSYSDLSGRKDRGTDPTTLKNHLYNFLYNHHKVKPSDGSYLWTTYKPASATISGGRYKRGWIAYNTKATNSYIKSDKVAYLCNNFPNTFLVNMVTNRSGAKFNQDMWALSEMLQFLFRSKLRDVEDGDRLVHLYIPSRRMRELFNWWLRQDTHEVGFSE